MSSTKSDTRALDVAEASLFRLWDHLHEAFSDVPYEWEQELCRVERNLGRIRNKTQDNDLHTLYVACETTSEVESLDALAIRAGISTRCVCGLVDRKSVGVCPWCGAARNV